MHGGCDVVLGEWGLRDHLANSGAVSLNDQKKKVPFKQCSLLRRRNRCVKHGAIQCARVRCGGGVFALSWGIRRRGECRRFAGRVSASPSLPTIARQTRGGVRLSRGEGRHGTCDDELDREHDDGTCDDEHDREHDDGICDGRDAAPRACVVPAWPSRLRRERLCPVSTLHHPL